jgi:hypothetical protein
MTFIRRKALETASWVVWLASPGCREWAEGLEREVAEIESDWAALRWATGGLRVVLDRRKPPMRSLAEVPDVAQKFVKQVRSGNWAVWYLIPQGPLSVIELFVHRKTESHYEGCALVIFCSLGLGMGLWNDRRRLKEPSKHDVYENPLACALFYREELTRDLSRISVQMLCLGCYGAGSMLIQGVGLRIDKDPNLVFVLLWSGPLLLMLFWGRRNAGRKIEEIDALLDRKAE